MIGPISGCHINPAVTLGFLLTRKIPVRHAAWAWIAQVLGGVFGAAVIFGIASGRDGWRREGFASNGWDRDGFSSLGAAVIVEIVFTALFVLVVLSTTSRRFAPGFGGIVAGITLAAIHLVTIPVDNTSVNPARSIATALFADTDPSALGQLWVFIVFPLVGSLIGVFVWLLLDQESRLEDTMLDTDILRTTRDAIDGRIDGLARSEDSAPRPGPGKAGLRCQARCVTNARELTRQRYSRRASRLMTEWVPTRRTPREEVR